jgi:SAM-dependent methyltransferase
VTEIKRSGGNWESFWAHGAAPGAAFAADTGFAAFVRSWWMEEIPVLAASAGRQRMADFGCGAGDLAAIAKERLHACSISVSSLFCIDYSLSAARAAAARLGAPALVAEIGALPLESRSIDIAVSQYGVEYAGKAWPAELARIMAPGGGFLALVHDRDGGLAAECQINLRLFDDFASCRLIDISSRAFRLGFAADRDGSGIEALSKEVHELKKAMRRCDELIARPNATQAMAFLRRVRQDVAFMLNRRRAYAESDIEQWFDNIAKEFSASRERFAAMLRAARRETDMRCIAAQMTASGVLVDPPQRVQMPSGASIGWRLCARRAAER